MLRYLIPPIAREEFRQYSVSALRADMRAGLTGAIFAAPQAVAYALLAGVPPVHGLYAAMVMSVVAACWGSSRFVSTGPTNSASLLAAAALMPWAGSPDFLPACFTLTLMVGLLRAACGLLRLGRLVQWVPESGFLGFTVGAGTLIALGQLNHLFNVPSPPAAWPPARVWGVLQHIADANLHTTGIGIGCLLFLLVSARWRIATIAPLFAIGLASLYAAWAGPEAGIRLVRDIAPVPQGLPTIAMPSFSLEVWKALLPSALAIAVVGLIEAVSIGQSFALKRQERVDFNQEFVGQGMSHIVSAFFQGMPGSSSFSRSALMEHAGVASRFGNAYCGLLTGLLLIVAPGALDRIPVSALAGLLLYVGFKLINFTRIRRVRATSRSDLVLLAASFFATVFVRIEYGIFVGVVLGALIFLHRACEVHLAELTPAEEAGRYDETPYTSDASHPPSDLVAITLEGDLFYGQAEALRMRFDEILRTQRPRALIVRMRRAHSVDYSCWSVLLDIAEGLARQGGMLYLTGVSPALARVIGKEAVQRLIPPDRVYARTDVPFEAFEVCLDDVLRRLPPDARLNPAWQRLRDARRN